MVETNKYRKSLVPQEGKKELGFSSNVSIISRDDISTNPLKLNTSYATTRLFSLYVNQAFTCQIRPKINCSLSHWLFKSKDPDTLNRLSLYR